MTLPTNAELAHQDAYRKALVLRDVGGEGQAVGSGWMSCDLPGSWADHAAGLGLDGPVSDDTLDSLVDFYRARGRTPRIETTPHQHPSLLEGLKNRGFVPSEELHTLVVDLDQYDAAQAGVGSGLDFKRVDPACQESVESFIRSQERGFFGEESLPSGLRTIIERVVHHPRAQVWIIERDGCAVGSGGLEIFEDMAVLIGGCVHPDARGQRVHSAFIAHRLSVAAQVGLSHASIGSLIDHTTEHNAARAGFQVAYIQTMFELRET